MSLNRRRTALALGTALAAALSAAVAAPPPPPQKAASFLEDPSPVVAAFKAKYGEKRVTDDPIEAGYIAVYLWAKAVEKAQSTDVEKVRAAAAGIEFAAPEGMVTVNGKNQHISKTVRIGKVRANGLIDEVWATPKPVDPDPYLETYDWGKGLK